nr:MAG TPA: hypothetical protein [Caudoviricetes sp.]
MPPELTPRGILGASVSPPCRPILWVPLPKKDVIAENGADLWGFSPSGLET